MENKTSLEVKHFQKLSGYFLKKGKKSLIENKIRVSLIKGFEKKKKKTKENFKKVIKTLEVNAKNSLTKAIPYIRLLMRKRGKRIKYKIGLLKKQKGERKAYLAISKLLRENKTGNFLNLLHKETTNTVLGKNNITAKKNMMHKTA